MPKLNKNEIKELHGKTVAQLNGMLAGMQTELAQARLASKVGKLADTSSVKLLADDIARVKTVITEKERAAFLAKSVESAEPAENKKEA